MNNMLTNVRVVRVSGEKSGLKASSFQTGRAIDTAGFEGTLFIVVGSSNAGGTTVYTVIQGASATGGTFKKLAGTSSTGPWTTGSLTRKVMAIDMVRPLSTVRFMRPMVVGSCTGEISCMLAIQYNSRKPGSSNMWKASTRAGSTLWQSDRIANQVIAISPAATTKTTG